MNDVDESGLKQRYTLHGKPGGPSFCLSIMVPKETNGDDNTSDTNKVQRRVRKEFDRFVLMIVTIVQKSLSYIY